MFNGFNKGFSLGFAGRVFNRGFSTKIASITRLAEVVEEVIDTSIITETNHRINTIEHNLYTVDFSALSGVGYIIFETPAANFPNTLVTFSRVDTNSSTLAQIVNYTASPTRNYYIDVGESVTLYSNGSSWSQTTSDGSQKVISYSNYFIYTLENLQETYTIDYPSNVSGGFYVILAAQPALHEGFQVAFVRSDDNTGATTWLFDQQTSKTYTITSGTTKNFYSYNGVWNEVPPPPSGIGGGGLSGPGGGGLSGPGGGGLIGP